MPGMFVELTVILCLATGLAIVCRLLRQPPLVAYILAGILIGPFHVFAIKDLFFLGNLGQVGITLLLFLLGLELKLRDLSSIGRIAVISGTIHMLISGACVFFLSLLLHFSIIDSLYISIALSFSSTIIVIKLLADKKDLQSLYGKISVGFLLVQDFFAILLLIILPSYKPTSTFLEESGVIFLLLGKGVLLSGILLYASKTIIPALVHRIARSQEVLFLFSLAWVFGIATFVSSPFMGFSIEIGGFLAGLSLANATEHFQILARMRPLRDFFLILFFVFLGITMTVGSIMSILLPALVLSLFVLITKPFLMMLVLGMSGYRKRTAFLTGINIAQVSEFSLILMVLGNSLGHISNNVVSLTTIIAIITFTTSTYMITKNNQLYLFFSKYLSFIEIRKGRGEKIATLEPVSQHVVLIGASRLGQSILQALQASKEPLVVIDFNPDIIKGLELEGVQSIFGDVIDTEIQERAYLHKAKLVISTVPDIEDNILLIKSLKHVNKNAKIVLLALDTENAKLLYKHNADYVMMLHLTGGTQIAKILRTGDLAILSELREKDARYLQ